MIPLRLVIYTNIIVSAALKPDGLQRTIVLLAITKPARLYVSEAIMAEYRAVLSRPELRIRKGLQRQMLDLIRKASHLVSPPRSLRVASDPADDIFIECADAAVADYLFDRQRAPLPEVLEQDEGDHVTRVHYACGAASPPMTLHGVADKGSRTDELAILPAFSGD
jgi:putative PIN family toxin of toxin-antitoxin system